jgi:general secretion pathway protein J
VSRPGWRQRGFTLVELLVAIAVMALLSVMAWRGLDGMQRAQAQTRAHAEQVQVWRAALAQWSADLEASTLLPPVGGIVFDGRVLRITRHYPYDEPADASPAADVASGVAGGGSIRVVAWGVRGVEGQRQWLRWQSGPLRTRAELQEAWLQAGLWGQNATDELREREVAVAAVDEWQLFYYRNNSWTSPQSSAAGSGTEAPTGQAALPDGVRLVLTLSAGQVFSGTLTRDWVRPTLGSGRP